MELSNLVNFFRGCYEADDARATIWNIFHGNIVIASLPATKSSY